VRSPNAVFIFLADEPKLVWMFGLIVILSFPCVMQGQRNGGHNRRPLICVHDCSNSADSATPEDELKDFNQVMALQGTPEQSAALVTLTDDLQLAKKQLHAVRPISGKTLASQKTSDAVALVDKSIAELRSQTQAFLGSFSPAQKSGLKELAKKIEETDADLGKQVSVLDEVAKYPTSTDQQLGDSTASVDKSLSNVEQEQLVLARQMGIILPSTELTFNVTSTNSMNFGTTEISIPVSADISRTSSVDGNNIFAEKVVADLSNLQDKIREILRTQIERAPACGERTEIREAMLVTDAPAIRIFTRVHVEHWICPGGHGQAMEVATGEGSLELRLTPSVEKDGKLGLDSQISHVDGDVFARDLLVGDVGQMFKEKITAAVAACIQKAAQPQLLPTSAGPLTNADRPEFRQTAGRLALVLNERMQLSDQQTQAFASQMKQYMSAQQRSSP
jgi:hypothetical protein